MSTVRLTMAQALVRFLAAQQVERDGKSHRFFEGCFGIFGHGNVTGVGQALAEEPSLLTYYQARNEQAMVHAAAGFARMRNRLATLACTTSIGPGATNMITGAAAATVNRLPVLLLPGDVFASRRPDPVLQQLEVPSRGDVSVNDAFIPVSRYWDRIQRPEQLVPAALAAMRVLTNQAETGSVTLALPQDVQAEAFDYPHEFFEERVWHIGRPPLVGDARATVEALNSRLSDWSVDGGYRSESEKLRADWDREVSRLYQLGHGPLPAQSEVIGAVNDLSGARDVVVCAAGSMPGDLHKLWRTRDPKGYHVEYGFSTMGYEIAGGLGVKMADPAREVYVMVGDGSYLMMAQEIVTSIQERMKLTVVLVDNQGFASIGGLSRSKGTAGFGTRYRYRSDGSLGDDAANSDGEALPTDLALNAEGLGAHVIRARNIEELRDALVAAKKVDRTVVIHIPTDRYEGVPDYDSWWEVPVAEVSKSPEVDAAREEHDRAAGKRRWHL